MCGRLATKRIEFYRWCLVTQEGGYELNMYGDVSLWPNLTASRPEIESGIYRPIIALERASFALVR